MCKSVLRELTSIFADNYSLGSKAWNPQMIIVHPIFQLSSLRLLFIRRKVFKKFLEIKFGLHSCLSETSMTIIVDVTV